jgi:hypothetical protein
MSSSITPRIPTIPVAVYYVVPVDSSDDGARVSDDHIQVCDYYYHDETSDTYSLLPPGKLEAVASGLSLDYVVLRQLSPKAFNFPSCKRTSGALLFSATAKNLRTISNCNPMPDVFLAVTAMTDDMPSVVIPVAHPELRGVILTFSVPDTNPSSPKGSMLLRGTRDPEIQGSTNG